MSSVDGHVGAGDIAIIGISCRLPGARNQREYWNNLVQARESITFLDDAQIRVDRHLITNPSYVNATGLLDDYDKFDADLFGISERLATYMTPEHRVFLESAWDVMYDAGYDPSAFAGEVATYAACNAQSIARYSQSPDWVSGGDAVLEYSQGWCPDCVSSYTLYHLGLTGEAMTVMALCCGFHSTVHLACQSLLLGQSEMAIAGGVLVRVPHERGYLWEEGKPLSRDGHCRSFDAKGTGAAIASGVSTVLLKPLQVALRDRDNVYAVVKGTAINNNGAKSVGFGLFQPDRLAACFAAGFAGADVDPDTVSMVEAVGAGLPLSDAVEVKATRAAFNSKRRNFCSLGSVKGNIGHAGVASGGASTIKAALALHHKILPASLHFESPSPELELESSPFYVQRESAEWTFAAGPRRAAVNSIGGAGFNAHLVLEEAPATEQRPPCEAVPRLVTVSAHTEAALTAQLDSLRECIAQSPALRLDDVCYTLNTGRKGLSQRWMAVVRTREELLTALAGGNAVHSRRAATPAAKPNFDERTLERGRDGLGFRKLELSSDPDALAALGEAWLDGHSFSRARLYEGQRLHRVSLPSYAFQRRRFWPTA